MSFMPYVNPSSILPEPLTSISVTLAPVAIISEKPTPPFSGGLNTPSAFVVMPPSYLVRGPVSFDV